MARRNRKTSAFEDLLALLLGARSHEPVTPKQRTRQYFPKGLLRPNTELRFYAMLKQAVPEFDVLPQVCMGALVDPPAHYSPTYKERARYKYQSKMVDFTIFDANNNRVVCLVELDDPTHDNIREKDAERDAITAEAGYRTVRWDVRALPTLEQLRVSLLAPAVKPVPQVSPPVLATSSPAEALDAAATRRPSGLVVLLLFLGFIAACWFGVMALIHKPAPRSATQPATAVAAPAKVEAPRAIPLNQILVGANKAVSITWQQCVVYGDAARSATAAGAGCPQVEQVDFAPGAEAGVIWEWFKFNQGRLGTSDACAPYQGWADEIAQAPDGEGAEAGAGDGEKFARLQGLYADALVKGCFIAPR